MGINILVGDKLTLAAFLPATTPIRPGGYSRISQRGKVCVFNVINGLNRNKPDGCPVRTRMMFPDRRWLARPSALPWRSAGRTSGGTQQGETLTRRKKVEYLGQKD